MRRQLVLAAAASAGVACATAGPALTVRTPLSLPMEVEGVPVEQSQFRFDVEGCQVTARFVEEGERRVGWEARFRMQEIGEIGLYSSGFATPSWLQPEGPVTIVRREVPSVALSGPVAYTSSRGERFRGDLFVHGVPSMELGEAALTEWEALHEGCTSAGAVARGD